MHRALRRALIMSAGVAAAAAPAATQQAAPPLSALAMLESGEWRLRSPDEPPRAICVANPYALMQIRHGNAACTRLVIADEKSVATVHYSCPGLGWGRTTVRVETPRLAHIDTQGIADKAPFAFTAELRRVGPCSPAAGPLSSGLPDKH